MSSLLSSSQKSHRYVLFLGAGASRADGVPLQRDLLTTYFATLDRSTRSVDRPTFVMDVIHFFREVFSVDLFSKPLLPTFEELLGLLDLAIMRGEALRGIPLSASVGVSLTSVRRSLILLMADAIRRSAAPDPEVHSRLLANLRAGTKLSEVVFVTTNYDALLDTSIEDDDVRAGDGDAEGAVDYGFEWLASAMRPPTARRSVPLIKIHGSLNWLRCPVCCDVRVTPGLDIITRLLDAPERARCSRCNALREPIIVPPTLYKTLTDVHLSIVWNRAAQALRDCAHLVFCGYSLPDADMHVKYLVKAAAMNRTSGEPLQISLINSCKDKLDDDARLELERYVRLFGLSSVTDEHLSFEEFAADPGAILGRPRG